MSLRLEMLQVARLAPKVLGDAAELVRTFLFGQQNADGAFRDRAGRSDLYYTVFGWEGLLALSAQEDPAWSGRLERFIHFLESQRSIESLDFVHLCCLARCWASARMMAEVKPDTTVTHTIFDRLATYRSRDGGFNARANSQRGSAYGAFLALGAHQDMGMELDDDERFLESLLSLRTPDGAWSNEAATRAGSTNATAAALSILNNQGQCLMQQASDWLIGCQHADGGFKAMPQAPIPDLLSTATALHALSALQWDVEPNRDRHLDFVDSLWTNEGAFHGNWTDQELDSEYTYYGLLALGHLSV